MSEHPSIGASSGVEAVWQRWPLAGERLSAERERKLKDLRQTPSGRERHTSRRAHGTWALLRCLVLEVLAWK